MKLSEFIKAAFVNEELFEGLKGFSVECIVKDGEEGYYIKEGLDGKLYIVDMETGNKVSDEEGNPIGFDYYEEDKT